METTPGYGLFATISLMLIDLLVEFKAEPGSFVTAHAVCRNVKKQYHDM
jgi:hypothetical protein